RMLHTLLGEQGFQAGMRLYIERHDGQAVTCDDFVAAMADANNVDLSVFKRWYSQAGTPIVDVQQTYNANKQQFTVCFTQHTPATSGQTDKKPVFIPMLFSLYSTNGEQLKLNADHFDDQSRGQIRSHD